MHAVKNESVSFGAILGRGGQLLLLTTEASGRGLATRKSQDCPLHSGWGKRVSHSPSPALGSPAASLRQAPSFPPRQPPLRRGQKETAPPHSHTARLRRHSALQGSWRSHGWRLLWSSPSGLEENTSLPQGTPARTKFPISSSAAPQNTGRGRCGVSQELKGKARSWNWRPRAIRRVTLLAGDQWEPWQEHTGEPLPARRRPLTPRCSWAGLLLPQLLAKGATSEASSWKKAPQEQRGSQLETEPPMMETKWGEKGLC